MYEDKLAGHALVFDSTTVAGKGAVLLVAVASILLVFLLAVALVAVLLAGLLSPVQNQRTAGQETR